MSQPISVTLYNPHKNQEVIHRSINSEPYKYYVLNIGRQFGKSLLAENQAYYWALNEPNAKIAWVSPIYKQCKKVFDEMSLALEGTGIITTNKSELEIKTSNGSTIQFFSSERYDNIRGFTFDYLICDEFAFMDSEAWTEVLRATVLVRGKKVLLISTPKGKNHFWQLYNLDGDNPQYKSFTMTSYHNPIINPTEIDDARLTLPEHVFRQEYLAEFIDGGSGLFRDMEFIKSGEITGRMYAGLDLGRADDYTVLTVFNQNGEMVFVDRWNHDTWSNIVSKVAEVINRYRCYTFVEVNSIGDAIFEQLKNVVSDQNLIQPFVTTSKSKQDIIEGLIVANNNKEVKFIDIDWLKKEFDIFGVEYNPKTKSVKYSAPSGFHDDGVMATAIGYHAYKNLSLTGVYYIS